MNTLEYNKELKVKIYNNFKKGTSTAKQWTLSVFMLKGNASQLERILSVFDLTTITVLLVGYTIDTARHLGI